MADWPERGLEPWDDALKAYLDEKFAQLVGEIPSDIYVNDSQVGAANGVAPLGTDSKIPDSALPTRLLPASQIVQIGSRTAMVTDSSTARPSTPGSVYWVCALGVNPTNAAAADLVWNSAT